MLRNRLKKQVRSFLGLAKYFRKFILSFATIAAPLTNLTKNGMPNGVVLGPAQERAFKMLRDLLTSSPILRLPDSEKTVRCQNNIILQPRPRSEDNSTV